MSKPSERRIILGVDDSPSGLAALQWAVSQVRSREAQLVAVAHEHMPGWRRPRRGSASRYCRSHAGRPVVVVATEQESL